MTDQTVPRVVGVISTAETLAAAASRPPDCDLIEIRFDQLGATWEDLEPACVRLEAAGCPIVFTDRWSGEGGGSNRSPATRQALFEAALQTVSIVDVEFRMPFWPELAARAAAARRQLIVSYHDFELTPPRQELAGIVREVLGHSATLAKLATYVRDAADLQTLQGLLADCRGQAVCLIGMGPVGAATRLQFPLQGSRLTYGYIDTPSAPGQMSCAELVEHLRGHSASYAAAAARRAARSQSSR